MSLKIESETKHMKVFSAVCTIVALINAGSAFGQQPASQNESHKNRTVFTLVGAGGGFALGLFTGLAAFDDSVNSDRKVWTTALLSAAGGGVGGYFIGRSLDKRKTKTTVTFVPNQIQMSISRYQWMTLRGDPYPDLVKKFRASGRGGL